MVVFKTLHEDLLSKRFNRNLKFLIKNDNESATIKGGKWILLHQRVTQRLGCPEAKQPTGNPSWQPCLDYPSDCTGRQQPTRTERQRKDWVVNVMYIKRTDTHVHSRTAHSTDTVGLSLLPRHLRLTDGMNDCGTDNNGMCIVNRLGLLFQDRKMT